MPKINPIEILTFLAECFPQALVREQHLPHKPLKIGIDADIAERCPAVSRIERSVLLHYYCKRTMYLSACVEGALRVDLDGNPAGTVSAADAEHAAAKLAEALAKREARRVAARAARRAVKKPATVPAPAALKPAPTPKSPTSEPPSTPKPASTASPMAKRPVLRLPAARKKAEAQP